MSWTRGHLAMHAAGRDHLIAGLECFDQLLVLLGPFLLRPDQQKIEDGEHANSMKIPSRPPEAAPLLSPGCQPWRKLLKRKT